MPRKGPISGEYYSYKGSIYKVLIVSSGTDEVVLEDISNKKKFSVRYGVFADSYTRVFRIGEVAGWLNRTARSIYRYEVKGQVKRATQYPYGTRSIRFYTLDDVFEMHEMISGLHRGRPRKDKRIVNNTLPDIGKLRIELRERFGNDR